MAYRSHVLQLHVAIQRNSPSCAFCRRINFVSGAYRMSVTGHPWHDADPFAAALVRANPGKYTFAHDGTGTGSHLTMELLLYKAGGVKIQHVPYKGIPQALQAAMTGEVLFNFSPVVNVLPLKT